MANKSCHRQTRGGSRLNTASGTSIRTSPEKIAEPSDWSPGPTAAPTSPATIIGPTQKYVERAKRANNDELRDSGAMPTSFRWACEPRCPRERGVGMAPANESIQLQDVRRIR